MSDWYDLASAGTDRWQTLLDEAALRRRARRAAPVRQAIVRTRLAAALVPLAERLVPAAPTHPTPHGHVAGHK